MLCLQQAKICYIFSSFENQWILSQCAHAVITIDQHWQNRDFHLLNRSIRHFLYSCLCDVYVESVKRVLNEPQHPEFDDTLRTLYVCITTGLRLLHPLMPFLTEELYQRINAAFEVTCSSISTESYPTPSEVSSQLHIRDNSHNCSRFRLDIYIHLKVQISGYLLWGGWGRVASYGLGSSMHTLSRSYENIF